MSLILEHITKRVGGEIHIDDISLQLEPGGFNVLLGRTLAGKTSLMRLMAGLDAPSAGRVLMNGEDVTRLPVQKRKVAMVYQQFINYPTMSVYNNIASPLRIARENKKEIDKKVREVAELLRIEALLERMPGELSGGQQQRTAMARALVKDADLLLFDEPLVNLDYKLRESLRIEMREIFKQRNTLAVYATTEPIEALTLSGSTAVLDEGRLLQFGKTAEVYHKPCSIRVGEVFSDPPINLLPGWLEGDRLRLGEDIILPRAPYLGRLTDGEYRFGIRANHLFLRRQSERDIEVNGDIELTEISGSETFIHLHHGKSALVAQEEGTLQLEGTAVRVYLDPGLLFAFNLDGELQAAPEAIQV